MGKEFSREDYIATIGFFSNTAIIHKELRAKVKKLHFDDLLAKSMVRESICDAIYTNDEAKKKKICEHSQLNGNYEEDFMALVLEYGVLVEILSLDILKKYI